MKKENKTIEIKIWMLRNGLTGRKLAKGYGCKPPVLSDFVKGGRASKGLANYFIKQGCPAEYFKDGRVAA